MTKGADIKEVVDRINASFGIDWNAEAAHIAQHVANDLLNLEFDFRSIPVKVVTYYPFCDCGEPVLLEKVLMCKEITIYGYGYMETCYECAVISSD
ncbi:hypothetical protein E3J38_05640 [candidate division TA06 bacterium]|uniref:Uncharacterized protein n=1 Tax=candidate division TA06 bacterium TaxID=2250710 RepID=A0A523XM53_UNCT6|nr:MAG: hypothetical protein E3J38_05640 [candidate division TA06 bacterium]